jgi:NAD(P)-dependent dehydrogenase (short-subunit alcohol dehydrogenase family)
MAWLDSPKAAALEYAKQGIRVNCVYPGYIRTPMVEYVIQHEGVQLEEQMAAREPIGVQGGRRHI